MPKELFSSCLNFDLKFTLIKFVFKFRDNFGAVVYYWCYIFDASISHFCKVAGNIVLDKWKYFFVKVVMSDFCLSLLTFSKWLAFLGPSPQRKCVSMAECGNSKALFISTPTSLMVLMNSICARLASLSFGRSSWKKGKKWKVILSLFFWTWRFLCVANSLNIVL